MANGFHHTCNGEPNEDGRILPDCSGCYDRAYVDGRYSGENYGMLQMKRHLINKIIKQYNPYEVDEKEAISILLTGRTLVKMVQSVYDDLVEAVAFPQPCVQIGGENESE